MVQVAQRATQLGGTLSDWVQSHGKTGDGDTTYHFPCGDGTQAIALVAERPTHDPRSQSAVWMRHLRVIHACNHTWFHVAVNIA